MIDSLAGNLLVASTLVQDPVCANSVCLLVHHDVDGAIGVMLNRPLNPHPDALMAMLGQKNTGTNSIRLPTCASATSDLGSTVHFGGPLSGPVVAIHADSQFAEAETGPGIYVAAQKHHLEGLFNKPSGPMRLIVGHLGWQGEQLSDELRAGIWHLLPATSEAVFASDRDMWPRLIRRATARSMASWIGAADRVDAWEVN